MKYLPVFVHHSAVKGRTPHGVRGLKFVRLGEDFMADEVAPLMGCVD